MTGTPDAGAGTENMDNQGTDTLGVDKPSVDKPGVDKPGVDQSPIDKHSVDYFRTFIAVAPDSPALSASAPPPAKDPAVPTIAARTFELIDSAPYRYTSGDVIFTVWADRRGIPESGRAAARAEFYSKGQPCLRSSDLGKRYGWGVHADEAGRIALYAVDSPEYAALASGVSPFDGEPVALTRAMRSSRK